MAAYREHIAVSGMLGLGVGAASTFVFGFTPVQGILAGWLTAIGGILPDLDSESGRPVREMFGLTAAVAPLIFIERILHWAQLPGDKETVMALFLVLYLAIKYGLASLVSTFSVHRGMFHSVPALLIAAEIAYLGYPRSEVRIKALMAAGVAIGFFSHLLLDEIYSVEWSGVRLKLKKSAGSAIKFFGEGLAGNAATYALLFGLTGLTLYDAGIIGPPDESPRMQAGAPAAIDADPPIVVGQPAAMPAFEGAVLPQGEPERRAEDDPGQPLLR
jgi:membrane-bound metal-dependent hydrolase YbcI (DUF457 family)